ncbi:hypothetical protein GYA27_04880 [candidate division WWE3 bacterium]|uniref:Uncharacterized protein n=1 Tax=candidate division WWE3 bacterium TaxID=2053526 RepID=A0A7X9HIC4_UNCKA|nr:hypothetical protein [candidate division WWE3 bacterium]
MRVVKGLLLLLGAVVSYMASRVAASLLLTSYQYNSGSGYFGEALWFVSGLAIGLFLWSILKTYNPGRQTSNKIKIALLVLVFITGPLTSWVFGLLVAKHGMFGLLIYIKILLKSIGLTMVLGSLYFFFGELKLPSK